MRYFFDTEFYERGHQHPIQFISLGMVSEDGREFYVENADVDLSTLSDWLKENVVPHLRKPNTLVLPHAQIGPAILKFIEPDLRPHFWAYFSDYDWVVFCQLFGSMVALPEIFPHYCRDLKQEMWRLGVEKPTVASRGPKHDALADARWVKDVMEFLIAHKGLLLPDTPVKVSKLIPTREGHPLRDGWRAEALKPEDPPVAKVFVHLLKVGVPLCRFTHVQPGDWPAAHKWAATVEQLRSLDTTKEQPCMECVRQDHLNRQRVP